MDKSYKGLSLPTNVSIVSWNYDVQLELSYQYFTKFDFYLAQKELKVFPSAFTNKFSFDDKLDTVDSDNFCATKLNGTAGYYHDKTALFDPYQHSTNAETMTLFKNTLFHSRSSGELLSFAWENDDQAVIKARKIAKEKIAEADALIIVGYSFPDFNRLIDKQIFADEKLAVIYLQDPNGNDIIQKLDGVKRGLREKTKVETQTSNFTIPFEFWEEKD